MADDLETTGSDGAAGAADPGKSKPSQVVDYEAKYKGLNSAYSKLTTKHDDLQRKFDEMQEQHESELGQEKSTRTDIAKQAKTANDQLAALTSERDSLKAQLDGVKTKETLRATVREKFPNILNDWEEGLLRERAAFGTDEEYSAYLLKMNERLAPTSVQTPAQPEATADELRSELDSRRRQVAGLVPPAPARQQAGSSTAGDMNTLKKQLWDMGTPRTPEERKKYDEIVAQMDKVLG